MADFWDYFIQSPYYLWSIPGVIMVVSGIVISLVGRYIDHQRLKRVTKWKTRIVEVLSDGKEHALVNDIVSESDNDSVAFVYTMLHHLEKMNLIGTRIEEKSGRKLYKLRDGTTGVWSL